MQHEHQQGPKAPRWSEQTDHDAEPGDPLPALIAWARSVVAERRRRRAEVAVEGEAVQPRAA